MEYWSQLKCAAGLIGVLLGTDHIVVLSYMRMLKKYEHLFNHLGAEMDEHYGTTLGPLVFNFHVHLALQNWLVNQFDDIKPTPDAPSYSVGLEIFEAHNNLMWAPSMTSVPALKFDPCGPCQQSPSSAQCHTSSADNKWS
jgi:hypothetical protein